MLAWVLAILGLGALLAGAAALVIGGLLAIGLAGRVIIVAAVFLIDPDWFHGSARLHWPEPTLRNFVAICLILLVASASSHPHGGGRRRQESRAPAYDA